ncbi:MAG: RluA family pseudouridine synthase [Candidatus Paceibacterota bacterium]
MINKELEIIYKKEHFLAINKSPGLLVHPSSHTNKKEVTLADLVVEDFPEVSLVGDKPGIRPGIVHRLDRFTSGVMIVARTQEFFDYFKKLLKIRDIKKTYWALVWGKIEDEGVIDTPIGLINGTTRRSVVRPEKKNFKLKMVKDAYTTYKPLKNYKKDGKDFTLLELYPKTGRTHQLRVHLLSIHHQLVADGVYGKRDNPFGLERFFLHAKAIEFTGIDGVRLKIEAPLTEDLQNVIDQLE